MARRTSGLFFDFDLTSYSTPDSTTGSQAIELGSESDNSACCAHGPIVRYLDFIISLHRSHSMPRHARSASSSTAWPHRGGNGEMARRLGRKPREQVASSWTSEAADEDELKWQLRTAEATDEDELKWQLRTAEAVARTPAHLR
jgi:hypothetical protein